MASALLAIVVGLAAVANCTLFSVVPTGLPQVLSVIGQGVLSVFAIIVFVTFQGRKTWRDYDGVNGWTVPRGITWVALIGTLGSFVVMLLAVLGIITGHI